MAPRKKQAIFEATLDLVAAKGYDGLTIEGVADRSGVNKTTIYRWWPSKAALLGAALVEAELLEFDPPDTGSLRGDLTAMVDAIAKLLDDPPTREVAVAALGAAVRHPELDTRRFFADRFAREQEIFQRAVRRGELDPATDPMLLVDLLAGAVWIRVIFRDLPLTENFARDAVGAVLDGVGCSSAS
ncbi:TetR/AcrR family transcriptional regulator [Nonomuraea sp. NPDC050556]|uniref:TetR/AcrR family transcriptional regulator n=1 Tax=Nonomuraea sp. NPDC050556 TaxID=3364369 RepID=UPI0037B4F47F